MEETNLLELITKDKETIWSYLVGVTSAQFIEDVKTHILRLINKDKIEIKTN